MRTVSKFLMIVVACAALSACEEEAKALRANPQVVDLGMFDGCQVSFVDRGYPILSFYIARCGQTVTTTRNYKESQGKSTYDRRSTVITQEIEKLQVERSAAETKEAALAKLSDSERIALGLK